jgi:hypothetical protein
MPTALDERKLLDTLQETIRAVKVSDAGGADDAFAESSVVISPVPPGSLISHKRTPIAQIAPRSQRYDPDTPGVRYATVAVTLFVLDRRDDDGQAAIMGANNQIGLEALSRRVDLSIQLLTRGTVPIISRGTAAGAVNLDDGEILAYREHTYEAVVAVEDE